MSASNTKRIAKNTLMLYFRQILIMGVSLYTVRVVLNTLGAEDYGIYNVVAGVVVLFSFLNNAMATSTQRFLNFNLGKEDTESLVLYRSINSKNKAGDTVYLSKKDIDSGYALENEDLITIFSRLDSQGTIFLEGAVGQVAEQSQLEVGTLKDEDLKKASSEDASNPVINRMPLRFSEGENLATLVRRNRGVFFPTSDLRNAYIVRKGEKISVNLEEIIYNGDFLSQYNAENNDTLFVPYMENISTVIISGEVTEVTEVSAWPQKRLSTVIEGLTTPYSSTRNITVTAIDGTKTTYDLFLAYRFGQVDQNPYLKPGETVFIGRIDRCVSISGAVERPGTYELLEGENLADLIEYYGNGLAPLADSSRLELFRSLSDNEDRGEKLYLSKKDIEENFVLKSYDTVFVSSFNDLKPTVFVRGAIKASTSTELSTTSEIAATFDKGEDYAFLIRRNKAWFNETSDTQNAYIIRDGKNIPLNINRILYDASFYSKEKIQNGDVLMIPFRQFFVSVSGAVHNPGRYPYIPDRDWEYYIGLAGGFINTQNAHESVTIRDMNGKKYSKNDPITPETTIEANTNSILFYFNQYAPVITTILSVISTSISVMAVTGVF